MKLVKFRSVKETEGFILMAQDETLPTNCRKAKIQHVTNRKCCLYSETDETVDHLLMTETKFHKLKLMTKFPELFIGNSQR